MEIQTPSIASAERACTAQALDFPIRQPGLQEHRLRVRTCVSRRAHRFGAGAAEAGDGRVLLDAVHIDEGAARDIVRMARGFGQTQYRRKTSIRALENLAPLLSSAGREGARQRGS
jgi:hypothetical protein